MMELIVISAPERIADEAQVINHLFEAGLTRLHLRKPGWDIDQLTKLLMQIDAACYPAIALHQHHQLAESFGTKRLHYTEQNRISTSAQTLKARAQDGYILSTSVHNVADIDNFGLFDYVFFGPVFNSISKPGYNSTLPPGLNINKNAHNTKVIALGGVHKHNLNTVQQMNFDGAAVLGTIWCDPQQAVSSFLKIKKATEQLNS